MSESWSKAGDWLIGPRYRISRMDLWHGRVYQVWDWYPEDDWAPVLLGMKETSREALEVVEVVDRR